MKQFLILYGRKNGSEEAWHQEVANFIAALDNDPVLKNEISYCCLKAGDASERYYHLASAADEKAIKTLGEREFFKNYKEATSAVAGGHVEVLPLEIIARTKHEA